MKVKCLNCSSRFEKRKADIKRSPRHFCSRSCSTSFNNKSNPKRVKTKKCSKCNTLILSSRQRCPECIKMLEDMTIADSINSSLHRSSASALIRSRARTVAKNLGWKSCCKCGYNKHVEIAHKTPISSFSEDTLISEVNRPENLMPLCPNCHWEYDHQDRT